MIDYCQSVSPYGNYECMLKRDVIRLNRNTIAYEDLLLSVLIYKLIASQCLCKVFIYSLYLYTNIVKFVLFAVVSYRIDCDFPILSQFIIIIILKICLNLILYSCKLSIMIKFCWIVFNILHWLFLFFIIRRWQK